MLAAVLAAREARWNARLLWARTFRVPILTCTLRLPWSFREDPALCARTRRFWEVLLRPSAWNVTQQVFRVTADGPEGMAAIPMDALELKRLMATIEQHHPLGWMMDLDVLTAAGQPVSRAELNDKTLSASRRCLVCERPAKECIVLKRHTREETCEAIRSYIEHHLR